MHRFKQRLLSAQAKEPGQASNLTSPDPRDGELKSSGEDVRSPSLPPPLGTAPVEPEPEPEPEPESVSVDVEPLLKRPRRLSESERISVLTPMKPERKDIPLSSSIANLIAPYSEPDKSDTDEMLGRYNLAVVELRTYLRSRYEDKSAKKRPIEKSDEEDFMEYEDEEVLPRHRSKRARMAAEGEGQQRSRKKSDDKKKKGKDEDFQLGADEEVEDEDKMDIDVEGERRSVQGSAKSTPKSKRSVSKIAPKKVDGFVKPQAKPPARKGLPKPANKKPTRGRRKKRSSDESSDVDESWDEADQDDEEIDVSPKKDLKEKPTPPVTPPKPKAGDQEVPLDLSMKKRKPAGLEPLTIPGALTPKMEPHDFTVTPIRKITRIVRELDESGSIDVDGSFEPVEYTPMATPNMTPMLTPTSGPPSPFKARSHKHGHHRRLSEKLLDLKNVNTEKKLDAEGPTSESPPFKVTPPSKDEESGDDLDDADNIEV